MHENNRRLNAGPNTGTVSAIKARDISSHLIGRSLLVDGIGVGTLSGYRLSILRPFHVTLYAGGSIRIVRKSAHIVY